MKHLATFLSVVALILAVGMLFRLRVHGVLWAPALYLMAQTLFALTAWWGIQTHSLESRTYTLLFGWEFGFVLLLSCVTSAVVSAKVLPGMLSAWLMFSAVDIAALLAAVTLDRLGTAIPQQLLLAVVQGAIVLCCGLVMLVCLIAPMKPELQLIATALGGFWSAIGLFMLLWAIGITRNLQTWLTLNNFLPSLLAIAAFSWLAWQLSNLQGERVLEPVPAPQPVSLQYGLVHSNSEREGRL